MINLKRQVHKDIENDLQIELVRLQEWIKKTGQRIIVVFEGRDAAGKGGIIKTITERVSPRVFKVVALPAPSDREKTQLYFQRYMTHFPAAGEIVLFDRSWYNRLGVEKVMGFCTQDEYDHFLQYCPLFEKAIVESGITLIKYFFDVNPVQQRKRLLARITDSRKHWKLSDLDIASYQKWNEYSEAYNIIFDKTSLPDAEWYIIDSNNKKEARIACIQHLLSMFNCVCEKNNMPSLPELDSSYFSTAINIDKCIKVL